MMCIKEKMTVLLLGKIIISAVQWRTGKNSSEGSGLLRAKSTEPPAAGHPTGHFTLVV